MFPSFSLCCWHNWPLTLWHLTDRKGGNFYEGAASPIKGLGCHSLELYGSGMNKKSFFFHSLFGRCAWLDGRVTESFLLLFSATHQGERRKKKSTPRVSCALGIWAYVRTTILTVEYATRMDAVSGISSSPLTC